MATIISISSSCYTSFSNDILTPSFKIAMNITTTIGASLAFLFNTASINSQFETVNRQRGWQFHLTNKQMNLASYERQKASKKMELARKEREKNDKQMKLARKEREKNDKRIEIINLKLSESIFQAFHEEIIKIDQEIIKIDEAIGDFDAEIEQIEREIERIDDAIRGLDNVIKDLRKEIEDIVKEINKMSADGKFKDPPEYVPPSVDANADADAQVQEESSDSA